jgi:hypothetical protein
MTDDFITYRWPDNLPMPNSTRSLPEEVMTQPAILEKLRSEVQNRMTLATFTCVQRGPVAK